MPTITSTQVSTPRSFLGGLDLCQGIALYPAIGTLRAGVSSSTTPYSLISHTFESDAGNLKVILRGGFTFGICGPAYVTDLTVNGTADANRIDLTTTQSLTIAGFEMGLSVTLRWDFEWDGWFQDAAYASSKNIDLMGLLLDYYSTREQPPDDHALFSGQSFVAIESTSGGLARAGAVTLNPDFTVLLDLIQHIPGLEPVVAFFKSIGGRLEVGPTITLVMPVNIAVTKVRTDGHEYTVTGAQNKLTGNRTAASTVGANEIEVVVTHSSSVKFGLGFGFSLAVLKYFGTSAHTQPFDLLSLVGLHTATTPFDSPLRSAIGASGNTVAGETPAGQQLYEVIFEEDLVAAAI